MIPIIGSFDYLGEGCIPVCVPECMTIDGLPIIIFPPEGKIVMPRRPYNIQFTTEGTKTREVDGTNYRIGHCIGATQQDPDEEDFL
jgi:hypothetical protein